MPRQTLKTASTTRAKAAAKRVASKIADSGNTSVIPVSSPVNSSVPAVTVQNSNGKAAITVPGLSDITPDKVAGMLPQFNESAYHIADPLNPPENAPQVSQAQFDRGMAINEGMQRALKLTGASFDTTRERFVTISKQVKAIGEGVKTATEIEKVKGNYLDYLNVLETNEQKAIQLDLSQFKTTTDRSKSVNNKIEMGEKLKQSEIAAEKARQETLKKQGELTEFQKQLGDYVTAR